MAVSGVSNNDYTPIVSVRFRQRRQQGVAEL